jgi:hypothetical protein
MGDNRAMMQVSWPHRGLQVEITKGPEAATRTLRIAYRAPYHRMQMCDGRA